jgi:sporulation protein YlmC with PRC-barrel domain
MAKQKSAGEEDPLILGYEVYNSEGEKIGQVEETYHGTTGLVEWMGVRGDGSAGRLVLLPLKTAQIQDGKVYVPYSTMVNDFNGLFLVGAEGDGTGASCGCHPAPALSQRSRFGAVPPVRPTGTRTADHSRVCAPTSPVLSLHG